MEGLEMEGDGTDEFGSLEEPEDDLPNSLFLVGPPALAALEAEWHAVFLQDKPFSVHRTPFTEDDVWDVELARQYPGDLHPDLAYGEALALFRLERFEEAQRALDRALDGLPRVPRFLTVERVRKPKIDPVGVRIGGDDQAWLYRKEMRDVWDATPAALEWLRKVSKRRK